ncbi:helix-turn-helix domain-containing protein [Cohnella silvisoli]|uniref:Helix-turn-helix domain-containing protein n=1 Tax=Cohnella silvisoli TaxID=2873699 RepID=A0ABV1KMR5_9BACL|nr:helix-turn-helix domain-containing protein [Cohnella silvisoli]MCD9020316.1 helix-turn-helix domain-containing protein [Cohnella silvisoli]
MSLWNNIKRYSIYRKLLVSYLLLVLLSILLISAFLYQRFSYQAEAEINRVTLTTLDQLDQATRSIQDRVISVGSELLHEPDLIAAMLSDSTSPLLENEVVIKLRNIQAVYPFIEYISVYNSNTGRYLNHRGITKAIDGELIGRIENGGNGAYMEFVPRRLDLTPLGTPMDPIPILSYVLYSNFSNLIPKSGAIIIHVNEEKAIGELTRSLAASTGNEWMVLDGRGMVISHSDPSQFLNNLSNESFVKTILASPQSEQGHFTESSGGDKQLINFSKSAKTGWILIGKRPYEQLFLGLDGRQTIIWAATLILTIIGVLLAFRLASRMFRPYSAFQNQQTLLEASWKRAYPLLQESYLRKLLTGQKSGGATETNLFEWPSGEECRYCVIVAQIDDYRQFLARSNKDRELIRFAIRNIADELMKPYGTFRTLEVENDHLVILVRFGESKPAEHFLLTLIELQQTVRQYFRMTVTLGIGDVVHAEEAIKDSYHSAHGYLKYRLFVGHGSIIDRDSIASQIGKGGDYPAKMEDSLIDAIKLGHKKEADMEIDRFLEAIRPLDYKYAFVFANQLVISVHKQFVNILSFEDGDYETHGSLLYSFSEFETLNEIGAALKPLCATVIDRIEEKRGNRNLEMIESVLQLIRSHYNDPNLSLEWAADRMHYSSGHLSKLFKQATHQSFNDYVNAIRLNEAVRLLRQTNDSAAVISEKVGLGSTYFFTLFKKTYGMTPAQFRLTPLPEETPPEKQA